MRTIIVIAIGLLIAFLLPRLLHIFKLKASPFVTFAVLWGAFCIFDTWYGVTHAGYSVREEAIIHAVVFCVPIAALTLYKKFVK